LSALLSLANVSAGYGSFRALFDVSLEVESGEAVGVIGPNGAGKTTLMRVISGLLPMRGGAMALDGRAVGGLPAHRMVEQGIAHVPENRRLFPRLSVEDNLRIGAFIPQARAHYAEQLERVYALFPRLKDRRTQIAGTLSGGEQQMCAIGRALMSRPKMILLDEPSMGLAPQIVEEIFSIMKNLNESEGVSFLLAEQNVNLALKYAGYGYILENGRVVLDGTAAALGENEDVKEFYLGVAEGRRKSFREGKHYKRRKRWLA
jgi:branched-chain amino acid transport system ATP-binding protein